MHDAHLVITYPLSLLPIPSPSVLLPFLSSLSPLPLLLLFSLLPLLLLLLFSLLSLPLLLLFSLLSLPLPYSRKETWVMSMVGSRYMETSSVLPPNPSSSLA